MELELLSGLSLECQCLLPAKLLSLSTDALEVIEHEDAVEVVYYGKEPLNIEADEKEELDGMCSSYIFYLKNS